MIVLYYRINMAAFAEIQSKLGQHKGKVAAGIGLVVASAYGINYLIKSGHQDPRIKEIAPIIQPISDDENSGGGDIEGIGGTQSGVGCWDAYGISYYPVGAVTEYTHSKCLGNSLWEVPNHGGIILYQAPQLPHPVDR